jgi:hypothetical protein
VRRLLTEREKAWHDRPPDDQEIGERCRDRSAQVGLRSTSGAARMPPLFLDQGDTMPQPLDPYDIHSPGWVFQTWVSFVVAIGTTAVGIAYLPVDHWMHAFLGMGLLFSVGSTFNLAKTVRDLHEAKKSGSRVDGAVYEKMLTDHPSLR